MTRFDITFRDYTAPTGWRLSTALEVLDVTTETFDHERNAGADGYSYERVLAINPTPELWSVPVIAVHELAHIVLGHTEFVIQVQELGLPHELIPVAQFELEAHTVAQAVGYGLNLSEIEFPVPLMERYITSIKKSGAHLSTGDAVRLARAALTILAAGVPALDLSGVIA